MVNVFELPEDHWLHVAHGKSIHHRREVMASKVCGCFYCKKMFKPDAIEEWTDTNEPVDRQTALCPHCGIDSVIGDRSGFEITEEFLSEMNANWFELGSG